MPTHSYKRILIRYGAFKNHVSLFAGTPVIRTFKQELAQHDTAGATVRFPFDQPLPQPLIRKLTKPA